MGAERNSPKRDVGGQFSGRPIPLTMTVNKRRPNFKYPQYPPTPIKIKNIFTI